MKILQLTLNNLNSLHGTWSIDFTVPEYATDGIFLISGPTGAGKSTILDAVCLALYGQTPRLGRISKSANEIMSRQTGECFAEVLFAAGDGIFRAHWSQHRSRRQPDGELQPPRHELSDGRTGRVLESKVRETQQAVEQKTGMDFERFSRSMLLAQGAFAAFLNAGADERAPVLEQITGTEVYSEISVRVHERMRAEKQRLEMLRAEAASIDLLTSEQRYALEGSLEQKQHERHELLVELGSVKKALSWLERITKLEGELHALRQEEEVLAGRREAFRESAAVLDRGLKALNVQNAYTALQEIRSEQREETVRLDRVRRELPVCESECRQSEQAFSISRTELEQLQRSARQQREQFGEVRLLDDRIKGADVRCSEEQERCREFEEQAKQAASDLERHRQRKGELERELADICDYLQEHAADERLTAELAALRQQSAQFGRLEEQLAAVTKELDAKEQERMTAETAFADVRERREALEKEVEQVQQQEHELSRRFDSLCEDRPVAWWRERLEQLRQELRLLERARDQIDEIGQLDQEVASVEKRENERRAGLMDVEEKLRLIENERMHLERERHHLDERIRLENRVLALEEERARLVEGQPCPLCGSTTHPLAQGLLTFHDDLHTERDTLQRRLDDVHKRRDSASADQAQHQAEIRQLEERREELGIDVDRRLRQVRSLLSETLTVAEDREAATHSVLEALEARALETDSIAERLRQLEDLRQEREEVRDELQTRKERLFEAVSDCEKAGLDVNAALEALQRLQYERKNRAFELRESRSALQEALTGYGIVLEQDASAEKLMDVLQDRLERWNERRRTQQELSDSERALQGMIERCIQHRETALHELERHSTALRAHEDERKRQHERRRDLFGDRDPDAEERRLDAEIAQAQERHDRLLEQRDALKTRLQEVQQRADLLERSVERRRQRLQEQQHRFDDALSSEGFRDEADFLAAVLEQGQLDGLSKEAGELEREASRLEVRTDECRQKLEEERSLCVTELDEDQLSTRQQELDNQLDVISRSAGAIEQQLQSDDRSQSAAVRKAEELERQQDLFRRWERMHELIGSSDGKKYRNFVQSLTFEMVVAHANRQLVQMTDRYLLVCDDLDPLSLDVVDNVQGGEIRSTKNLSGGESFIVSMALALGLSHMASRKVPVDSLFLDEGFGTLDEDALETALDALAALQQRGKLVGIISHVAALRERLSSRITVTPFSGGKSGLRGPGVKKLR
ncbi:MAG: AAA family ATPase [Prosthecochloris sp.]|nr:AAA family ATPase [Prosthecochloris sp.]